MKSEDIKKEMDLTKAEVDKLTEEVDKLVEQLNMEAARLDLLLNMYKITILDEVIQKMGS